MNTFGWKALVCIPVILLLGGLSGFVTSSSIDGWYRTLERPPGTPPDAVFGPVWTVLYAMIGLALARVWHASSPVAAKRGGYTSFAIQFLLNLSWTPVFFGAHQPGWSLGIIVLLVGAIVWNLREFLRVDRPAGYLLLPYLAWVSYATYLNAGFWWLN